jgi:Protein of unknown function (DUF664)
VETSYKTRLAGPSPPWRAHAADSLSRQDCFMIEETARHAGHLDIARELLDGQTGLGQR